MHILAYIHILRFLSLIITLIAFICHIYQCILLNVYQQKTGIPDWLSAGHWQYLLWFISLSLSLAGSSTLCLSACYFNRPKKYAWDKWIGSLAVLPVFVSIITAMTSESFEPWTNDLIKTKRSSNALVKSCSLFDASRDKFYPLLYQRCVLSDTTWIFSIILCIIWPLLVGFAIFAASLQQRKNAIQPAARSAKLSSSSTTVKAQEPNWGRYIPDKPPAASIYSITTRRSSVGLLTPTSVKYGSQYYFEDYECSVPSLPSTKDYYYSKEKGGGYDDDSTYFYKSNYKSPISPSSHYPHYNSNGRSTHSSKKEYYYRSPSIFSPSSYSCYDTSNYSSPPTPSSYHYNNSPTTPLTKYSSYDLYQVKQHLMRPLTTSFRDASLASSKSSGKDEQDDVPATTTREEISTPLYLKFASKKLNNYSLR